MEWRKFPFLRYSADLHEKTKLPPEKLLRCICRCYNRTATSLTRRLRSSWLRVWSAGVSASPGPELQSLPRSSSFRWSRWAVLLIVISANFVNKNLHKWCYIPGKIFFYQYIKRRVQIQFHSFNFVRYVVVTKYFHYFSICLLGNPGWCLLLPLQVITIFSKVNYS